MIENRYQQLTDDELYLLNDAYIDGHFGDSPAQGERFAEVERELKQRYHTAISREGTS